ncbi:hypothetical protein Golob_021941 [Gossypium lobatum]|uniref:Uncharacterized protein n=1 Tax=Gossypium lobatum TaxID=34289 RepID=A0A7J8LF21_9ROSI|nr:hypothetical protein [Gossypium lobatum]
MKLNLVERRWGIDEGRQTEVAIFTLIKVLCLNQQNPLGDLSLLTESCISRRHTYNQHQESQFVVSKI